MLKPLGDRVVLKLRKKKSKQLVVLSLLAPSKERTQVAKLLQQVGDGARTLTGELVAPSVAAGDKVIIENGVGIEVKDDDNTVTIVREADILAILA